ncbi:lytic transglycosylase domain-containing protein [Clostridium swellfunianum]|uniref:lytic transglycosylase domain-containing protein n=1 Tax=Clostridium swellfunianum TaxID=1367462 RepID=UPI00202F99EC|nr:lytic transglycosylase domain-containing protein [Clostridium swellfunianum]MCM0648496.1 lytic transglycosylase domain-containing protein [Clostridium swellfunianum]
MKTKIFIRSFVVVILVILLINAGKIARLYFPLYYSAHIQNYSQKYNLNPYLVAAVIRTESNFRPKAKSSKNAFGLMQITTSTGEWAAKEMKLENFSAEQLQEPEYNIRMGCWYLDNLKKEFDGDMDLVLAAYNGGRGNVQKWLADETHSKDGKNLHYIPFKETDKYVKRVKVFFNIYKFLYRNTF